MELTEWKVYFLQGVMTVYLLLMYKTTQQGV